MRRLVFALLLLLPAAASAQEFRLPAEREVRLSGRVFDADSGAAIPTVVLRAPTAVGVSRYDGAFSLDFRARGSVEIRFEKEGYVPESIGVSESGGVARTVKMKQVMGTLYGVLAGCSYDGKSHRWDDMSGERVEVTGVAVSGQRIHLAMSPAPDGGFVVGNLPVGEYLVRAGEKTASVKLAKRGEAATVSLTARWCMRKEFHPDLVEAKRTDGAKGKAGNVPTLPVPAPRPPEPGKPAPVPPAAAKPASANDKAK